MTKYIINRFIWGLVTLFIFTLVVFIFAQVLIPGDFVTQFSLGFHQSGDLSGLEEMREELGLSRPMWQQYLDWMSSILRGNLGTSYYGYPVVSLLQQILAPTLLVFILGMVIAFFIGNWLGRVVAWRSSRFLSNVSVFGAITFYTSFPPWLSFLVVYLIYNRVTVLWSAGRGGSITRDPYRGTFKDFVTPPHVVMYEMIFGFIISVLLIYLINRFLVVYARRKIPFWGNAVLFLIFTYMFWIRMGISSEAIEVMKVAIVPIIVFVLLSFGETMLIMRTSMMDTLHEDYVMAARAKGLPEQVVRDKHAARNAFLPVLSRFVVSLPYILTGLVIIERSVDWSGMGSALFSAMENQDMPVVMGALLLIGLLSLSTRLLLDLSYAILDPRIRLGKARVEVAE